MENLGKYKKEERICCGCGRTFVGVIPPGPRDFPPYSCGRPECDEARVQKIRREVG